MLPVPLQDSLHPQETIGMHNLTTQQISILTSIINEVHHENTAHLSFNHK